ncbi:MAG TPA: J domain-containing protein [Allosphingosinicella sp.]|nr:J domain-containing protein [Allosphingosinicella sp.]
MASPRNHYAILNVAPDAEPVVIEAAYRALMKKYHPDQGAPVAASGPSATEINAAFAVLRDPERRAEYDHREWTRGQAIQLAQFQAALPPPRRASNFFGWGGWFVALVLAGALGLIASQSGSAPPMVKLEAAKTAALPDLDLHSQPPAPLIPPAELAQIQADAYAGHGQAAAPSVPVRHERIERPVHPRLVLRHRTVPTHAAPDKDFVERHGGIY